MNGNIDSIIESTYLAIGWLQFDISVDASDCAESLEIIKGSYLSPSISRCTALYFDKLSFLHHIYAQTSLQMYLT